MRLIIEMTDVEHAELKQFAAEKNITMRQIAMAGIRLFMDKPAAEIAKGAPPKKMNRRDMYNEFTEFYRAAGSVPQCAGKLGISNDALIKIIKTLDPVTPEMLQLIRSFK
jgi:hypothetical protein